VHADVGYHGGARGVPRSRHHGVTGRTDFGGPQYDKARCPRTGGRAPALASRLVSHELRRAPVYRGVQHRVCSTQSLPWTPAVARGRDRAAVQPLAGRGPSRRPGVGGPEPPGKRGCRPGIIPSRASRRAEDRRGAAAGGGASGGFPIGVLMILLLLRNSSVIVSPVLKR
jgi:hypothetical protein